MSKNPLKENVFHDEENWKNNVIIKNKNNSEKYNSFPPKKIFNDTFQNKNMKKDKELNINFDTTSKDRKKHIPTYTKLRNTQRQEIPLRNFGLGAFN